MSISVVSRRHTPLKVREKLGGDLLDSLVVTTGQNAYRRKDGIAVVPAALLGP